VPPNNLHFAATQQLDPWEGDGGQMAGQSSFALECYTKVSGDTQLHLQVRWSNVAHQKRLEWRFPQLCSSGTVLRQSQALVGKGSSVAHQKSILWRTGGAPQNSRHKNKVSVAHRPMRHRKSYFCGAPPPVRHRIFF
jgi:hypothetical protein